jgi:hypothetical protein
MKKNTGLTYRKNVVKAEILRWIWTVVPVSIIIQKGTSMAISKKAAVATKTPVKAVKKVVKKVTKKSK